MSSTDSDTAFDSNTSVTASFRSALTFLISIALNTFETFFLLLGIQPSVLGWKIRQVVARLSRTLGIQPKRNQETYTNEQGENQEGREQDHEMFSIKGKGSGLRNRRRRRDLGDAERRDGLFDKIADREGAYYPGMVNLSGTLCYMNSVLQAFASLSYLQKYLLDVQRKAEQVDVETSVVDELFAVLGNLNHPSSSPPSSLRPHNLLTSLSSLSAVQRLLNTREHQDAHELWLLLTGAIGDEVGKVEVGERVEGGLRDLLRGGMRMGGADSMPGGFGAREREVSIGIKEASSLPVEDTREELEPASSSHRSTWLTSSLSQNNHPQTSRSSRAKSSTQPSILASPFSGLSANRRSCLKCGWCEAIRYESMGGLDVAVPMSGHISLNACIRHFTKIESLDAVCDSCTLRYTLTYYESEAERLSQPPPEDPNKDPSTSGGSTKMNTARRKRAREARSIVTRLTEMRDRHDIGDMERREGLEDVRWVKAPSRNTKQSMMARPPPILCLHLVRSEYTNYGQIVKKTPFVAFPSILDITEFTTTGSLRMTSDGPISGNIDGWDEPVAEEGSAGSVTSKPPRVLYRLDALICHYGFTHSFGHFVAYRRIPTTSLGPDIIRKSCPDYCGCADCEDFGQVRYSSAPGRGWLRISDADVEEVGEGDALGERGSAFMLFYEKVLEYDGSEDGRQSHSEAAPAGGESTNVMDALKALRETKQAGSIDDLM